MSDRFIHLLITLTTALRSAQDGQGLVEYAAMLGFVACCMVVAEHFLQPQIAVTLNTVANSFPP
jgi:Flp pilus assembly pilin Flp